MPPTSAERPRRWRRTVAALFAGLTLLGASPAGAADPTSTSAGTPGAPTSATTTAPTGTPTLGALSLRDGVVRGTVTLPSHLGSFTITDQGRRWRLPARSTQRGPLAVTVAVDVSGSMDQAALDGARAQLGALLELLATPTVAGSAPARVSVLRFATRPRLAAGPSALDDPGLARALDGVRPDGDTALYDALALASDTLGPAIPDRRAVVVVLTDGADTASDLDEARALASLQSTGASLVVVPQPTPRLDADALSGLTARAGGRLVSPDALPAALGALLDPPVTHQFRYRADAITPAWRLRAPGVELRAPASAPTPTVPVASGPTAHPDGLARWAWAALMVVALTVLAREALGALGARREAGRTRQRVLPADLARASAREPGAPRAQHWARLRRPLGMLVAGLVAWFVLGPLGLVAGPALVWGGVRARRALAARRRIRALEEQLPDALVMLAGALRAGHGLTAALEHTARELDEPAGPAFLQAANEVALGVDVAAALAALAAREHSEDLAWVAQAVAVQSELGGSLAELVDQVAATIRERGRLRRRVSALSAEGRLSAVVLTLLPLGLVLLLRIMNPAYLATLTGHPLGWLLCGVGTVLLVVGGVWMRALVKVAL